MEIAKMMMGGKNRVITADDCKFEIVFDVDPQGGTQKVANLKITFPNGITWGDIDSLYVDWLYGNTYFDGYNRNSNFKKSGSESLYVSGVKSNPGVPVQYTIVQDNTFRYGGAYSSSTVFSLISFFAVLKK